MCGKAKFSTKAGEWRLVPGPKSKIVIERNNRFCATTTNASRLAVKTGKGIYLKDCDNNEYIDFNSGVGCANIGHGNSYVADEIRLQYLKIAQYISTDFHNPLPGQVAEFLSRITPGNFEKKTFFGNSGTEAVEAAVKLVFENHPAKEKTAFIAFDKAFHGRTGFALPLMSKYKNVRIEGFPIAYSVIRYPYPAPDIAEKVYETIKGDFENGKLDSSIVGAIIFEPVCGEGGILVPHDMEKIVNLCRSHGLIIIVDEVQTGIGRTGKMFACEHFGIEPDIICLAKAFGGGVPASATVYKAHLDWKKLGRHSNTNGGNNLAMAAFLAEMEVMQIGKVLENTRVNGEVLAEILQELRKKYPEYIVVTRGLGLMQAIDFINSKFRDQVVETALDLGLVLIGSGTQAIRIMPPLIIKKEELLFGMNILENAISQVVKNC